MSAAQPIPSIARLLLALSLVGGILVLMHLAAPVLVAILPFAWHTLSTAPQTFAILMATIVLAWVAEAFWRGIKKHQLQNEET